MATQAALPIPNQGPLTWTKHAACRGMNTDIFFRTDELAVAQAKSICAQCVVRPACLDYARQCEGTASDTNLDLGIYGGLTYAERRSYWRRRRANG